MDAYIDCDDDWDNLWVQVRSTFVEVFKKKPEFVRSKSVPASVGEIDCSPFSCKVGLFSSCACQASNYADQGVSALSEIRPGSDVNPREQTIVAVEDSMEKGPDVEVNLPRSITQAWDRIKADRVLTFMVCDLPCIVGEKRLMIELYSMGFDGCYDYLYFPKRNLFSSAGEGYCFINFMSVELAHRFKAAFEGYQFFNIESTKRVRVEVAELQGREANLCLFSHGRKNRKYICNVNGIRVATEQTRIHGTRRQKYQRAIH
eukprot:TRINITY_DN9584_c0_g1_i1.p1 TRINITY_DN9584_c0_g1~~TRINITY_DN9584_c0_g1_i1.p1  ORF type:complete len:260 (-),score=30.06 TRINITY_DN9584_c0_g1_i1:148-927(-)